MSQPAVTPTPVTPTGTRPQAAGGGGPAIQRQFVNFAFFKLDPALRRTLARYPKGKLTLRTTFTSKPTGKALVSSRGVSRTT